jgi:hypothetical protein
MPPTRQNKDLEDLYSRRSEAFFTYQNTHPVKILSISVNDRGKLCVSRVVFSELAASSALIAAPSSLWWGVARPAPSPAGPPPPQVPGTPLDGLQREVTERHPWRTTVRLTVNPSPHL